MLLNITSTGDGLLNLSTLMTLNDLEFSQKGSLVNFCRILRCDTHFKSELHQKWLEVDQDNLHMKFLAWNVDFSSPSLDPLDSSRPAHVGVNERYPCKKWLFIPCACLACKWLQIGTAMLLIITSTDEELLTNVNIDNLE